MIHLFKGLIPKEKPKNQTVRDIKKRENERRSRDRDRKRPPTEVEEDKQASYAANSAGIYLCICYKNIWNNNNNHDTI